MDFLHIEQQLKNTLPENEKSLLLNYGTRYELIAKCEKTYNQIFGSQIQALKALVNNTYLDLTSFYDIHKIKALDYPDIQYNNFESWVQFLIETMLVIKNENGKYSLTEQGKYVIKYFEDNKLFLDRAF